MGRELATTVLSIGYAGRVLDEVVHELVGQSVERVADVRSLASSTVEGFSRDELAGSLGEAGLDYRHFGELGDFQVDPYDKYMKTDEWAAAYDVLKQWIDEASGRTCILCQCADVSTCHRRFLSSRLKTDGYRVVHLTPAGPREAVTFDGT